MNGKQRRRGIIQSVVSDLAPGEIRRGTVDIADLHKDERYQRLTNEARILEMAEDFNDALCEEIAVVLRDDGLMYVIDGWHRAKAAELAGRKKIRARIFRACSYEQETKLFSAINKCRVPVSKVGIFVAGLEGKDPVVCEIFSILKRHGFTVSRTPGAYPGKNVMCVSVLEKIYLSCGPKVLERIVVIIEQSWDSDMLDRVKQDIFKGLTHIISRPKRWGNLDDSRLIAKLKGTHPADVIGYSKLLLSQSAASHGKCMAEAIIQKYNKNLRGKSKQLASAFGSGE